MEILNLQNFSSHVYHLYIIRITKDYGLTRDKLNQELKKKGINVAVADLYCIKPFNAKKFEKFVDKIIYKFPN